MILTNNDTAIQCSLAFPLTFLRWKKYEDGSRATEDRSLLFPATDFYPKSKSMHKISTLRYSLILSSCLIVLFLSCCKPPETSTSASGLEGKVICVDAGHGGTAEIDSYRVGVGGEREEWINLRVARYLKDLLENEGAQVVMTRTEDVQVGLQERAELAKDKGADVLLSIHHNAAADTSVNFPIIYYHANATENEASVKLARLVGRQLLSALFPEDSLISIASDHTIFPTAGTAVLRHSYGVPGIIGEATFFTNPSEEQRLRQEAYNLREAQAYLQALIGFFDEAVPPIEEKYSHIKIPAFQVLQEAERMAPTARLWLQDYQQGKTLYTEGKLDSAFQFLTRSARSFPDSYVASDAHRLRGEILLKLGKTKVADTAFQRVEEYYVELYED
ncbi:N-acetylmuramoyl-L-alanine amidase [Catalinimonas alkaloidigena]|uniref:N-acetylmuramoyl-L-alanine amidase n=1 Tax=Catalinimonas alkaloidigena TaxID=1075417 RepID=UPI002404BE56|nr:N-acetylmuramoyl-L-alanine amidase [Catalinimonas alkaloidigena]MDF9796101.1 N-acetylmuramoyl-L-alanine amidase [Catalinimonas alkaloidigena]